MSGCVYFQEVRTDGWVSRKGLLSRGLKGAVVSWEGKKSTAGQEYNWKGLEITCQGFGGSRWGRQ